MRLGTLLVAIWMCLTSPGWATNFSEFLGKPTAKLEEEIGDIANCKVQSHAVHIPLITLQTTVQNDLLRPVSGRLVVEDEDSVFVYPQISVMSCQILGSASIVSYSRDDKAFRIEVTYTRCKTKAASGNCLEIDEIMGPYDLSVFSEIQHKDAYLFSTQGSFYSVYESMLSDPAIERFFADVDCGPWVSSFTYDQRRSSKCIADISFADGIFSATTLYEIYDRGYLRDTLLGRYVGRRVFVDVEAEREAKIDLVAKLDALVTTKKQQLRNADSESLAKDKKVDSILGAPPGP